MVFEPSDDYVTHTSTLTPGHSQVVANVWHYIKGVIENPVITLTALGCKNISLQFLVA